MNEYIASRKLTQVNISEEQDENSSPNTLSIAAEELKEIHAWILIGEPGSGKTKLFEKLANDNDMALYIHVRDFLFEESLGFCENKILFLDGLDEYRNNENDDTLRQICRKLKELKMPKFRISCRATDWYGTSDENTLRSALPNHEKILVYKLAKLERHEIIRIIQENVGIKDSDDFIAQVSNKGIGDLLYYPYTLKLLANIFIGKGNLPNCRTEIYELACKQLIEEPNKIYRDKNRRFPCEEIDTLKAGELFSAMLLSNKMGVALDKESENSQFPSQEKYPLLGKEKKSIFSAAIFKPSVSKKERLIPTHRTIAEFLAAKWLARQIDKGALSAVRLLGILEGFDKKAIFSLRGLYGWIATLLNNHENKQLFFERDPLTVLLNGDIRSQEIQNKKKLLNALTKTVKEHQGIYTQLDSNQNARNFFSKELEEDFLCILNDKSHQFMASSLILLRDHQYSSHFSSELLNLVKKKQFSSEIQNQVLRLWSSQNIYSKKNQQAIDLLDELYQQKKPTNNRLIRLLIESLYPHTIKPKDLLEYYVPSNGYLDFWAEKILKKILDSSHALILLDKFKQKQKLISENSELFFMFERLIQSAVAKMGDRITNKQLFSWLSISNNTDCYYSNHQEFLDFLRDCFKKSPQRYEKLLESYGQKPEYWIIDHPKIIHNVLFQDNPPLDPSLWYLKKIRGLKDQEKKKIYLRLAWQTLNPKSGLAQEVFFKFIEDEQIPKAWYERLIQSNIPTRKIAKSSDNELDKFKNNVVKEKTQIRSGEAIKILSVLARIWLGEYTELSGKNPEERFKKIDKNDRENCIYYLAQEGFKNAVRNNNAAQLGSVDEVLTAFFKRERHAMIPICMIGIDLLFQEDAKIFEKLSNHTIILLIGCRLLELIKSESGWWDEVVKNKSDLVVSVFLNFAKKSFCHKQDLGEWPWKFLQNKQNIYESLAKRLVPTLLQMFPRTLLSRQRQQLEYLLKSAIRYGMHDKILQIIGKKNFLENLRGVEQKIYWLTSAALIKPKMFDKKLREYLGNSWKRAVLVSKFLHSEFEVLKIKSATISTKTAAKLIELLAPHSIVNWPIFSSHRATTIDDKAMQRREHITIMLDHIVRSGHPDGLKTIEKLLTTKSTESVHRSLRHARDELAEKVRQSQYTLPSLEEIVEFFKKELPYSCKDLWLIIQERLDNIAYKIISDDSNIYEQFWNDNNPLKLKKETSCRDVLLEKLRESVKGLGIIIEKEGSHRNNKRDDIKIIYNNNEKQFEVPIEIKHISNRDLWKGIQNQLIDKYLIKNEYGVYVVLWASIKSRSQPIPDDGGKRPLDPKNLKERLTKSIPDQYKDRIVIKVINIDHPTSLKITGT